MSSNDEEREIKEIMNAAQVHLVVATLLVTVTFAAGFTLPGGFESDRDSLNKGMAILAKRPAFRAFVVTDAIAFVCSAGAVFCYYVMAIAANLKPRPSDLRIIRPSDLRIIRKIFVFATYLQLLAVLAVVIAFITGLYATLAHSVGLAATVCVIGCLTFLIYVSVFYLIGKEIE